MRDPFGRIVRRFKVEMSGVWSDEHRALHLDETYAYIGGGVFHRSWAIHADDDGFILGHDAQEAARLSGRSTGSDFEMVFDRLSATPRPFGRSRQVIRFAHVFDDRWLMLGRSRRFGVALEAMTAALRRIGEV